MHNYLIFSTEQQLQQIYKSCNATEESLKNDVKTLIQWLEKHPYLPKIKDEEILFNILLRSHNSLEKAKKNIDVYYTARAEMPEVFQNRDLNPQEIVRIRNFGTYVPMRHLTSEGYRLVIFHCPPSSKIESPNMEAFLKSSQMSLDIGLKVDKLRGLIIIIDFGNFSLTHVTSFLSIVKKLLFLQTELTPVNFHKIYLLNLLSIAEPLVSYGKAVVGAELANKIEVWKQNTLTDIFPDECLPQEFGGTENSLYELSESWFAYLLLHKEWFKTEEQIKADLSKKPKSEKERNDSHGVSGSFRKLCVD